MSTLYEHDSTITVIAQGCYSEIGYVCESQRDYDLMEAFTTLTSNMRASELEKELQAIKDKYGI